MIFPHKIGTGDLYQKYRPLRFKEIIGQKETIKSINNAVLSSPPPQAYLFVGESGSGKTTTSRIMALALNCEDRSSEGEPCLECPSCTIVNSGNCVDVIEMNASDARGIDDARHLRSTMSLMPMQVKNKIYILDEAHGLTGDAQNSLLKVLEEAPSHVFIILCTTDPQKIKKTVKNRCQQFQFNSLRKYEIMELLTAVSTYETYDVSDAILNMVADKAEGSPRNSLVLLQQVSQLGFGNIGAIKRLLLDEQQENPEVIKICFELCSGKSTWAKIMSLYKSSKDAGPPAIGMMIAGYFRNRLIGAKNPQQADEYAGVLELFQDPFPPAKIGENKLVLNLYKAYRVIRK